MSKTVTVLLSFFVKLNVRIKIISNAYQHSVTLCPRDRVIISDRYGISAQQYKEKMVKVFEYNGYQSIKVSSVEKP